MKILVVIILAALSVGCDSMSRQVDTLRLKALHADESNSAQRQHAIEQVQEVNPETGEVSFSGETIYVIMSDFQFTPDLIRLKSGAVTRIRLSNTAWVTHYFGAAEFFQRGAEIVNILESTVPAGQHHIPVAPFSERDVYVLVKAPGEYPLSCHVPNHLKAGMQGMLVVEPAPL